MSRFVALYDACVLYPAPLRDFLMRLALTGLFQARWSAEIQDEWIRNVLRDRQGEITPAQLSRTRELMEKAIPDSVIEGYSHLIPSLTLPDPDDRHVLAAAIVAHADVIVTFNLKDFPLEELAKYNVEAIHPDAFAMAQIGLSRPKVCEAVQKQRAALKNPPKTAAEFLDDLERQGLPLTAADLRDYATLL